MGTRIILVLILVRLLCGPSQACGIDVPEPATPEAVAAFVAAHSNEDQVDILTWVGMDLKHDEAARGFGGTIKYCHEYVVLDKALIKDMSEVQTSNSPSWKLKKFEVTVDGVAGHRRWRKKDLRWISGTERGGGVVTLDGTVSMALVPGIEVGDRVRVVKEYRVASIQGLPFRSLGKSDVPYLTSSCELRVPSKYEIRWSVGGAQFSRDRLEFSTPDDDGSDTYRWSLAADPDGELPHCRERYPFLHLVPHVVRVGRGAEPDWSYGETWAQAGDEYLKSIEGVFDVSEEMATLAAELTGGAVTTDEKIDLMYSWVQQRCHYLGLFRGTDGVIPASAASVYHLGSGDCKGLATLLIGMLRSVGVVAHPVLVLTDSGGRLVEDVPNMVQFNHFIAWAEGDSGGVFLDGTVDRHPAGAVPLADAASRVLLLKPGEVELVAIPASAWQKGSGRRVLNGRLADTGHAEFEVTYTVTDALARDWRNHLSNQDDQTKQKAILGYLVPAEFPCTAETAEVRGLDEWQAPMTLSATVTTSRPLPMGAGAIYVPRNIAGDVLISDIDVACGGRLDLRAYADRQFSWQLELPVGYEVVAPDSVMWQAPGIRWERQCWQEGQVFRLERKLTYTREYLNTAAADTLSEVLAKIRSAEAGYFEVRQR